MTVEKLIEALRTLPATAIVAEIDIVEYHPTNNVVFFGVDYDEEDDYDFPDDVDETNYNPYMGCDEYEYEPFDEGW